MGGGWAGPLCFFTKGDDYHDDVATGMGGWIPSCEYRDGALEALLCMSLFTF
jgi:hypothetical protein